MDKLDLLTENRNIYSANLVRSVVLAALIVGTLDITAAIVQTLVNGGKPLKMLQFIASGVFGKRSFTGGGLFALYGLLFHYLIASCWTAVFFLLYPKLTFLWKNRWITGVGYGLLIWLVMNKVVIPLSATPALKFKMVQAITGMLILVGAIGIPLSFLAVKHYTGRRKDAPSKVITPVKINDHWIS